MELQEIKKKSLFLAPMEGVTDAHYRKVMNEIFDGWDYYASDFLRIPSGGGHYKEKKVRDHFGEKIMNNPELQARTMYQVLTPFRGKIDETIATILNLGFKWIDLNLGCPSKQVNAHGGGSALLSDLDNLQILLERLRALIPFRFTAKIRVGVKDDSHFDDILTLLEESGVDAITIHGRTRDQLYQGRARWDYIQHAVEKVNVPIIGNGDVWTLEDINNMFKQTNCHGIMMARGALKTPWMAMIYKRYRHQLDDIINDEDFLGSLRQEYTIKYFDSLQKEFTQVGIPDSSILKRFKGLSRYIFEDRKDSGVLKSNLLRTNELKTFMSNIHNGI